MRRLLAIVLALVLCASVSSTAAAEGNDTLPSGVGYAAIEEVMDAYVEEHKATTAALSVAVFTGTDVLMEKAYGYTDIENATANDRDAVFEWGSNTKLLVWTSVMQLVEKGDISLEDDIRTYLPDGFLTKLRFDAPVTMLNLMGHNAGWQETVTDLFIKDKADVKELGHALQLIEPEQVHEPGTVVAYSNWGSALAGYVVERVSGQPFDDYVHEHIFEPLGMANTALNATLSDNERVARKRAEEKGYTVRNEPLGASLYHISLYPAGMATGTISDFTKLGQAFLSDESPLFEKRETLDEMFSPSLFFADGDTARNCHGFWTDELGVSVLWHNGGTPGSTSWFAFDPKSDIGMIVLTNQSYESTYTCGLLPKVFGEYQGCTARVSAEDISGTYVSSRSVFRGFAKPYSLFSLMRFVPKGEGAYYVPGTGYTVKPIGRTSYLLDMGGLKQSVIHASTGEGGRTILQLPGSDYVEVNGYGVMSQCALLMLFVLAAFHGFFSIASSLFRVLKRKKQNGALGTMERLRAAVDASVVGVATMFVHVSVKLFSESPLRADIIWSVILIGALALLPVSYAVILAARWKRLDCTGKERRKAIVTGVAGLIMTLNVIFWEAYRFW